MPSKFPILPIKKNGSTVSYRLDLRSGGIDIGQKFKTFKTKAEAQREAKKLAKLVKDNGQRFANIVFDKKNKVEEAVVELKNFNTNYGQNFDLLDAVNDFIKRKGDELDSVYLPTVFQAGKAYIEHKSSNYGGDGGKILRPRTKGDIRQKISGFIDRFSDQKINSISSKEITNFLDTLRKVNGEPVSNQYKSNIRNKIRTFFEWCVEKEYIDKNPTPKNYIHIGEGEIVTLTNSDVKNILENALRSTNPKHLPYFVIGLYAGVRPSEIQELSLANINFRESAKTKKDGYPIFIHKSVAKGCRTRCGELHECGMYWLKVWSKKHRYNFGEDFKLNMGNKVPAKPREGIKWTSDVMRKTYITNWRKLNGSVAYLTEVAGNSVDVQNRHYFNPVVTETEAKEFFEISNKEIQEIKNEEFEKLHESKHGIRSDELPWGTGEPSNEEKIELEKQLHSFNYEDDVV